ncbi:hypothetical protein JOM56_013266 [Amanita muscaria]
MILCSFTLSFGISNAAAAATSVGVVLSKTRPLKSDLSRLQRLMVTVAGIVGDALDTPRAEGGDLLGRNDAKMLVEKQIYPALFSRRNVTQIKYFVSMPQTFLHRETCYITSERICKKFM